MDIPLSESTVPMKLAEIQKRCAELMENDGANELSRLSLEEPGHAEDDQARYCIPR